MSMLFLAGLLLALVGESTQQQVGVSCVHSGQTKINCYVENWSRDHLTNTSEQRAALSLTVNALQDNVDVKVFASCSLSAYENILLVPNQQQYDACNGTVSYDDKLYVNPRSGGTGSTSVQTRNIDFVCRTIAPSENDTVAEVKFDRTSNPSPAIYAISAAPDPPVTIDGSYQTVGGGCKQGMKFVVRLTWPVVVVPTTVDANPTGSFVRKGNETDGDSGVQTVHKVWWSLNAVFFVLGMLTNIILYE